MRKHKKTVCIKELVEAVIERIPAPSGSRNNKTQGLIFDSIYDSYNHNARYKGDGTFQF